MAQECITRKMKSAIVSFCNSHIVPDKEYISSHSGYESDWFIDYFNFIEDEKLRIKLGEAFHQARFVYKLMVVLNLNSWKNKGVVKFQIIQYASICEALLQHIIELYFLDEFRKKYKKMEYNPANNSMSKDTKILFQGKLLTPCYKKDVPADIKRTSINDKIEFCVEKKVIQATEGNEFAKLYAARNNIHILKATLSDYNPKVSDSKAAFLLMEKIRDQVKSYLESLK
mgnify:FL=1